MSTLGVVFFTLAGARPLEESLQSVEWADAVRVFRLNPHGSVESMEEMKRLASGGMPDWTLHLWSEERVEEELQAELKTLRERDVPEKPVYYRVPVRSRILGRWVDGSVWGPQPSLRLSRKVETFPLEWWAGRETHIEASSLGGWISDYAACKLERGLNRINAFSTFWATALQRPGVSRRRSQWAFPIRIFARLTFKHGLTKGLAGLTFSTLVAYTVLLGNAKLWEAKGGPAGTWRPDKPEDR